MAQISGRVVERGSDTPVAGANVFAALDNGQGFAPEPLPSAVSDAEGRFRLSGLAAGRYHLAAHKMGYTASMEMSLGRFVDVGQGDTLENVDLELARGGTIAGHVLDASGRAMEGIQVMALLKRLKHPLMAGAPAGSGTPVLMPMGGDTTTTGGDFEITGLPPGEYLVAARPQEGSGATSPASASDAQVLTYYPSAQEPAGARSIDVEDNQKVSDVAISLLAVPAYRVSGIVVDSGGRPVPHAGIMAKAKPGRDPIKDLLGGSFRMEHTDEAGRFTIGGVTPGTYELSVMTGGGGIGFHDSLFSFDLRDGVPRAAGDNRPEPPEPGAVLVTVLASDVVNVKLTTGPGQ